MTTRRRWLAGAAAAVVPACPWSSGARASPPSDMLGLTLTPEQAQDGVTFLRRHASIDVHAHPGAFYLAGAADPTPTMKALGAPFTDRAVADLAIGRVSAVLFAAVSDVRLLRPAPGGGIAAARDFAPGEAFADYGRQLATLKALVAGGALAHGGDARDIAHAHRQGRTACVFSIEGGDFIEDRVDRVAQAHADGVRAVTIVHYHVNQIGDIQTEPPRHGGLTPLGAQIVRAMNRAGIIVDLAHATEAVTRGAVDASSRPMMISHTNLTRPDIAHPRLIGLDHARMVTRAGGLIGSVPSGIGQATFGDWIESIRRLVDAVGVEHVAIGTDMDANFRPVFTDYKLWSLVPAALLARGLREADVAKVMGGNFLRLLEVHRVG